jgi:hypothetical protein
VNCNVCKRETTPVKIGGQDFCSVCGGRYGGPATTTPRHTLDLSPRPHGNVSATPITKPAAADLHSRVNPSRVIDLRKSALESASSQLPGAATVPAAVAHTPNHTPAAPPKTTTHERHIAQFSDRFERARKYTRSEQISRYGADRFGNPINPEKMRDKFGNPTLEGLRHQNAVTAGHAEPPRHSALPGTTHVPEMPKMAANQHQAMSHLATPATRPTAATAWRPNLKLSPHNSRGMAVTAAVAIMASYIWLQNYPKLAIQSASNQAGITASLPSYVPSSYNLTHTNTHPGLVTLSFASPSSPDTLTIAQHRTNWDSSSLLDNFVSKNADDYATVQGQGLTIYLFANNQAAWVNHGIWYSIEGASRLSREQILKMAYSL